MEERANCCYKNLSTSNKVATIIIDKYCNPYEHDIVLIEWVNGVNKR